MPVIFDPDDTNRLTVDAPHGRYTVTRHQPADNWHLTAVEEGQTVAQGIFAGLEVTTSGRVKQLRFGVGPFRLELLDALMLAAFAWRQRDTDRVRKAS